MKLKCQKCGSIIQVDEQEKFIDCPNCGAHGTNPLFKGEQSVQQQVQPTGGVALVQNPYKPTQVMSEDHKGEIVKRFGFYLPKGSTFDILKTLDTTPDNKYSQCMAVQPKNPLLTLLFSINFGFLGIDRFYIGDTGLGIAKLMFGLFTFGLWPLIDVFVSYRKCRKKNLAELNNVLGFACNQNK